MNNAYKNPLMINQQVKPQLDVSENSVLVGTTKYLNKSDPTICFPQLFERQASMTPNNIAVIDTEHHLTYAELNAKANQLAHYLERVGVGPNTLVGIFLERSVELMIGLLGILKAGGAYVPIDPTYPESRIAFMLEDANSSILITQKHLLKRIPNNKLEPILIDRDLQDVSQEDDSNPISFLSCNDLAYVLFTSGSTGRPKGVMIPHEALSNYLQWCCLAYPIEDGKGSLVHSSISFDLTVTGLFAPLICGKSVYLVPDSEEIEQLGRILVTEGGFSVVKITPSHMELLNSQLSQENLEGLTRCFVIGGENLTYEHLELWRQKAQNTLFFNEYGPTEATVGCTAYLVEKSDPRKGSVPIGCPVNNMQIHILDDNFKPVSIGMIGEIYISGVQLAQGYLNNPKLTNERFISNPFNGSLTKLYKTGDLARYKNSETIEFLGRIDQQLKIRGFRIEPEEIQFALKEIKQIDDAVVIAINDGAGSKNLVAFVKGDGLSSLDLRQLLKKSLPTYMIPNNYVSVESFPLTANGKIDRNALVSIFQERNQKVSLNTEFVPPRNVLEAQLLRIWQSLFNNKEINVGDDFFDLNGHSLLAMKFISSLKQQLNIDIPLLTLIENRTIEKLAKHIRQNTPPETPLVLLQKGQTKYPMYWVHPVGGSAMKYVNLMKHVGRDITAYGLQNLALDLDVEPLSTIEEIARFYVKEVKKHQPFGPYLLGGWSFGGLVALEMAHQINQSEGTVSLLAILDTKKPIKPAEITDLASFWWWMTRKFNNLLPIDMDYLRNLNLSDQLTYLADLQANNEGISPIYYTSLETTQIRRNLYTGLRSHEAQWHYELMPYEGNTLVINARECNENTLIDSVIDWRSLVVEDQLTIIDFPATHTSLMGEDASDLGQILRQHVLQSQYIE